MPSYRRARATAGAYAPSAITNFFAVSYDSSPEPIGATGGGYVLSEGTVTNATFTLGDPKGLIVRVNGDDNYNARTTRRAVELMLSETGASEGRMKLDQEVSVPIGGGFGASGASAISAVFAAASAAGLSTPKSRLAAFAHRAEILEQTGLGTVSVVFDAVGAGAITVPGEPGRARFVTVPVPGGLKIVTAFVAPFDKKGVLSSKSAVDKVNSLGEAALKRFLSDPTLETLAEEGERFSGSLGLESVEVKKLIALAKTAGAAHASQNMIGHSIHCLADGDIAAKVEKVLRSFSREVRVDVFEVGSKKAGPA